MEKKTKELTINNLNKFVVRHFEDQALSGLIPVFTRTRAQFRLVLVKMGIRPSLTPALRPYHYTHLGHEFRLYLLFVPSEHLVIGRQFIACVTITPLISPIGTIEHVIQTRFFRWVFILCSIVPTGLYGSFT